MRGTEHCISYGIIFQMFHIEAKSVFWQKTHLSCETDFIVWFTLSYLTVVIGCTVRPPKRSLASAFTKYFISLRNWW